MLFFVRLLREGQLSSGRSLFFSPLLSQPRLERCALGRRAGEVVLYDAAVDNHAPSMPGDPEGHGLMVPVRTLDECVGDWNIDRIDLMKIEVEGYEPEVFAGAARTFADGRVRAILCEFNVYWLARAATSAREVHSGLLDYGFIDRSGIAGEPGTSDFETRLFIFNSNV